MHVIGPVEDLCPSREARCIESQRAEGAESAPWQGQPVEPCARWHRHHASSGLEAVCEEVELDFTPGSQGPGEFADRPSDAGGSQHGRAIVDGDAGGHGHWDGAETKLPPAFLMRAAATTTLLIASLGAVAWLLWSSMRDTTVPVPQPGAVPDPYVRPSDRPAVEPRRPDTKDLGPRVVVEVVRRGKVVPPAPVAPLEVRRQGELVAAEVAAMAGIGTGWLQSTSTRGFQLVRVVRTDGTVLWRRVFRNSSRELVGVDCEDTAVIRGRVIDDRGLPIPGATVWSGVGERDTMVFVRSDEDGRFRIETPGGSGIPLVVQAAGKASNARFVDRHPVPGQDVEPVEDPLGTGIGVPAGPATPEELFVLRPGAAIAVTATAIGLDGSKGTVAVMPVAAGGDTTVLEYPFFLPVVAGLRPLDAAGNAELAGLPRGCTLDVVVVHPLASQPQVARVEVKATRAQVVVPMATGAVVEGVLVDPQGAPLAGAHVQAWRGSEAATRQLESSWLLPPELAARGNTIARSDGEGRFVLAVPGTGKPQIAIVAQGRWGVTMELPSVPWSMDEPMVMRPNDTKDLPALRILPPDPGPWRVRVKPSVRFVPKQPGAECVEQFAEPLLVDVVLQVEDGGRPAVARTVRNVVVVGGVTLPSAPVNQR